MRKEKKIFWLILISFFLLPYVFSALVNASVAASSDVIWVEKNYSTAQEAADAASSGSIEVDQTVARSLQENLSETIQGGGQILQISSGSNSSSFSRHIMCKDYEVVPSIPPRYNPIDPTTIFRPSDAKVECLTTVSVDDKIEFRWHYRSNSSKIWVSCYNWSHSFPVSGTYDYAGYLLIAGYWPGYHYPWAYKVDVHLDDSPSPAFSEFFEVTNGGLNSPRICEDVDVNGRPVNVKSRFTIGVDEKACHSLRFDKIAYFNEDLGSSHNFTTVWIQPNGTTYQTYSGNFSDYKDTNVTWNYWESNYTRDDYISINSSTPVGNWKVEVYLDSYFNNTWMRYGPVATTPFIVGNETVADWTFMVYLDADNNLEWAGIENFLDMASVGSSSQVNIVVQMDRHPDYDVYFGYDDRFGNWTDCKRFNVTKDMWPTPGNATKDLGEVNMGHPDTLKDFVNWTINNYPANYYFLVLWDHGAGCMGFCFDFTNETDFLSLPELSQALSGLPAIMDVVFLEACSMSMTEVAYQIKDYANVLVGPEGIGWAPAPYDDYLTSLTSNSSILPSAFATEVVTDYIDWCNSIIDIQNATMSATDLTKITSLTVAIDDFALRLNETETLHNHLINSSRDLTEGYQGPYALDSRYYIDLYHFAQLTYQSILDEELRDSADQVMTALESIIIIKANKSRPNSHGLSIFFPDEKGKYDSYGSEYEATTFTEDTLWDEFVKFHLLHQNQYYITVNSARGNPTASQWVDKGDDLTVTVTSPTETTPNQTRWNCIGYRIDNGNLQEGTSYSFENVQLPHQIEFSWVHQFWLQVNTKESGSTVEGTGWYDAGTSASISATPPYQPNSTHRFVIFWNSTGINEAPISDPSSALTTVTMNNYYTVQANWQEQYYLMTNTNFGTVTPISGWHDAGSTVQISTSAPGVVDGERYVWLGWAGTGDGNYTGMDNPAVITMNSSITETASWRHQYQLIMDTNFGTTNPSAGEHWHEADSTVEISAIAPSATSGEQYVWLGWTGTGSGSYSSTDNPASITMNGPINETAAWRHEYYLTITSLYGSPTPTSGWFEAEESINASVTSPMSGPTGTRYVCTGWTGTGSVSASGKIISVIFTIDEPSSITWNWKTQYILTWGTNPTGISPQPNVSPPGPWYDNGTQVTFTAQKISGRVFDHWTVDEASWDIGVNPITVTMDGSYEAIAHYVRARPWWETFFSLESLNFIIALVGLVLPVTLLGIAWARTRRKRAVIKDLLNKTDEIYSRFKMNRQKCEEELRRLRNTILQDLTDGKISQENYDILDKRIEEYMEELQKQ